MHWEGDWLPIMHWEGGLHTGGGGSVSRRRGICIQVRRVVLASQYALGRGVCIQGEGGLYPGGGGSASRLGGLSASRVEGGLYLWRGRSASRGGGQIPSPRYMGYYGIRWTNGRHASYWNAFLLSIKPTRHKNPSINVTIADYEVCLKLVLSGFRQ